MLPLLAYPDFYIAAIHSKFIFCQAGTTLPVARLYSIRNALRSLFSQLVLVAAPASQGRLFLFPSKTSFPP